jgi:hypothetical protein
MNRNSSRAPPLLPAGTTVLAPSHDDPSRYERREN